MTLEADPTGDTKDRYGRLLRYVLLDGENFNARLIREGYGHAIRRFRYSLKAPGLRTRPGKRAGGCGRRNEARTRSARRGSGCGARSDRKRQAAPLTQDGGAVSGAWIPLSCCASTGATVLCRHVPLFLRRSRFVPAQGSRQTGASPLPLASVTACRSCPAGIAVHK